MITFTIALLLLVVGYLTYGKLMEKLFGIDENRPTPAIKHPDGVDFVPMPAWKAYMIQFLNIAGTGPIFGAIMGARFGVSAYLWIVFGCIFIGALHDFMVGMLSIRRNGRSLPEIIGQFLGNGMQYFSVGFSILLLLLVGVVYIYTPAELLTGIFPSIGADKKTGMIIWIIAIFAYYILASSVPIDKIIGKIYPLFAAILLFMAVGIMIALYVHQPAIPEIFDGIKNLNPDKEEPIFPILFVSIACGAVSGFHATQSPIIARCVTNERQGRAVFYGAMITEGIVAIIWAAAAITFYQENGYADAAGNGYSAGYIVDFMSKTWLGRIGGLLAIVGVIVCPITSGDTAFRSARLIVADRIHLKQGKIRNRLLICVPMFLVAFGILMYSLSDKDGFETIWRYFAWANQTLATFTLWAIASFLYRTKGYWHYVALLPAMFMTMVVTTYIFVAPEGFGLLEYYNWVLIGAAVLALALSKIFYSRERKIKETSPIETSPVEK
ncbi:MAG: carbon starvation protein A [Paludibacteraceae bacterium]|nr:carbon starvation protein A [Paludibacteraceae bacterium]